jgi:hypothetical protein
MFVSSCAKDIEEEDQMTARVAGTCSLLDAPLGSWNLARRSASSTVYPTSRKGGGEVKRKGSSFFCPGA